MLEEGVCRLRFVLELSQQNKMEARRKLQEIRRTIEERTRDLKEMIINQRQRLTAHVDHHIQNLEEM